MTFRDEAGDGVHGAAGRWRLDHPREELLLPGYTYYASDHLGTPRATTGVVTETHKYQPFGTEITGSFGNQPLKFAAMDRAVSGVLHFLPLPRLAVFPQRKFRDPIHRLRHQPSEMPREGLARCVLSVPIPP